MNKRAAVNYIIPPPPERVPTGADGIEHPAHETRPYLWRWDDDFSSIVWTGDTTVCVWEELHALLHYLAPHGLPPVGSILMVLMACQQKAAIVSRDAKDQSSSTLRIDEPVAPYRRLLPRLKEVLGHVQALPADLRTGLSARAHLLRTLFEDVGNRQPPDVSRAILEQVDIWGIEDLALETPNYGCGPRLLRDLKALATVHERRDLPRLESLLRIGLEDVDIQPAPVPEPEPEPGESALPLLRQLEVHRDAELAAVAGLARRVVAMFSLPRPAGHPQELPVGGISDITNRGPLDRLLPGELAYDDLTLTARLANNEALYYRRDTPPDEPATERVILMDTGIHLWGTPRIFALAAALGLQAGAAEGESVSVFRREGAAFRPLALGSVAAVRDCLTSLHAAPDPEDALNAFTPEESDTLRPDVFFVSIARQREPVRRALHGLALRIAAAGGRFYVVTVSRTGALELATRTAAGTRVLAGGWIDPDTIFRTRLPGEDMPGVQLEGRLFNLPEVIRHLGFYKVQSPPFQIPVQLTKPGESRAELMGVPLSAGFDSAGTLIIRASGGYWELPVPNIIFKKTGKSMLSAVRPFGGVHDITSWKAWGDPELDPPAASYYIAEWNPDCRLIFDTGGVLHIVFHDMHGVVEIAVLCLLNKATAAWVRHWPAGKQHLGAKAWFADATVEGQPVVNLTPLMQRFSGMARSVVIPAK